MPQGLTAISSNTPIRMVVDAGVIYKDISTTDLEDGTATDPWGDAIGSALLLGATRGGATFSVNRVMRDIEVDGAIAPVKSLVRRSRTEAQIQATFLEMDDAVLKFFSPGLDAATAGLFQKLTGGAIADADYFTNVALAGTIRGSTHPVVIVLDNPLPIEMGDVTTSEDDEWSVTVTFRAHATTAAPNTEPFSIYVPTTLS